LLLTIFYKKKIDKIFYLHILNNKIDEYNKMSNLKQNKINSKQTLIKRVISNSKVSNDIIYNIKALVELLEKNNCMVIDSTYNPSTTNNNTIRKSKLLELFKDDNKFKEYSDTKWFDNDLINLDEFIQFLLLTPEIYNQNTKGKYHLYMDYIHAYLDVKLTDLYFPNYNNLDKKFENIKNPRYEYLYSFWINKLIINHEFFNHYINILKPTYQKDINNKYFDITFESIKLIIEIQEFDNHNNNDNDNDKLTYVNAKGYIVLYLKVNDFLKSKIKAYDNFTERLYNILYCKVILYNTSIYSDYLVFSFVELLKNKINIINNIIDDIKKENKNIDFDNDEINHSILKDKKKDNYIKDIINNYRNLMKENINYDEIINLINNNTSIIKTIFELKKKSHENMNSKILNIKHIKKLLKTDDIDDNDIELLNNKFKYTINEYNNGLYCVDWPTFINIIIRSDIFDETIKNILTTYLTYVENIMLNTTIMISKYYENFIEKTLYSTKNYISLIEKDIKNNYDKIIKNNESEIIKLKNDLTIYESYTDGFIKLSNKLIKSDNNLNNIKKVNLYIDNIKTIVKSFHSNKKIVSNNINLTEDSKSIFIDKPEFIIHYSSNSRDIIDINTFKAIMTKFNIHRDTYNNILNQLTGSTIPDDISNLKIIKDLNKYIINDSDSEESDNDIEINTNIKKCISVESFFKTTKTQINKSISDEDNSDKEIIINKSINNNDSDDEDIIINNYNSKTSISNIKKSIDNKKTKKIIIGDDSDTEELEFD